LVQRVAALYDIHGNLPALEAVLEELQQLSVDAIVVGGDVLPGPMPRECLELLHQNRIPTAFIHGNGESAALESLKGGALAKVPEAFRPAVEWSARQVPDEIATAMRAWPTTLQLEIEGVGDTLFCHATPRNDTELFTRLSPDERIRTMFAGTRCELAVCGHTHMQFDRTVDAIRVVNAGSVGMPFGDPGACWLLLGPDVQLRRTNYDLDAAAARLRQSGFPGVDQFVERQVLHPPSEAKMLEAYSTVDGRAT
jgi:putative phosphoesterase